MRVAFVGSPVYFVLVVEADLAVPVEHMFVPQAPVARMKLVDQKPQVVLPVPAVQAVADRTETSVFVVSAAQVVVGTTAPVALVLVIDRTEESVLAVPVVQMVVDQKAQVVLPVPAVQVVVGRTEESVSAVPVVQVVVDQKA